MANNLTHKLVTSEGWCCVYHWIVAHERISADVLASYLGIDPRSIRRHRANARKGLLFPCAHCPQLILPRNMPKKYSP